jgi:phosphoglycerate dehydrogenase-like enzyme
MKLVIGKEFNEEALEKIKDSYPGIEIRIAKSAREEEREIRDADILLSRLMPSSLDTAPRLRWIQFTWEGVDHLSDDLRRSDVIITNAGGAHSIQMAEHVFSYLLTISRKVPMYLELQKESKWLDWPKQPPLRRLYGRTIGILGYGRIGRTVARIAEGFGMTVLVSKRDPSEMSVEGYHEDECCDIEGSIPERVFGPDEIHEMLPFCDFVVVALPLTDETRDLIGRKEFMLMKDDSVLVNIGRGPIVNEKDLVEALEEGRISAAGLDVFDEEPLPPDNPLWDLDNVIITPHSGVGGDPADEKILEIFTENLKRFRKGEELINRIDKKKGY